MDAPARLSGALFWASINRYSEMPCDWNMRIDGPPGVGNGNDDRGAAAGSWGVGAAAVVTHNVRDVRCGELGGELVWEHLRVLTPAECLEVLP
jgi:hypothetical protein